MSGVWFIIALCVSSFCFCQAQVPTAKFSNTTVQGIVKQTRKGRDVDSFMGIPYAEPPIDDLRFRDPIPKVYPDETFMADKPPMRCLQSVARSFGNGNSSRDEKGDEDCLYLNVHRPTSIGNRLLPVMVYFQAADLIPGEDDISHIGPEYLLDKDIILVTINYRLGVFGFFCTGDEAAPGNFGLKDQKLALEWIQSNIKGFGGDSNRVTLFGNGEAAKNIHLHALVNHTAGLFHQYILQSGTALVPWSVQDSTTCMEWAQKLAMLKECPIYSSLDIVECLRMINPRQLLYASFQPFSLMEINFHKIWAPTIEQISPGAFLTDCPGDLFARGDQRDLPFIAGVTRYENTYLTPADFQVDQIEYAENKTFMAVNDALNTTLLNMTLLNMTLDSSDLIERVTQFYGGNNNDTIFNSFDKFEDFLNDFSYYSPQVRMLEERRENSRRPFYFYSFEYRGEFSMIDWLYDNHGVGEATHGDDLLYLFHHNTTEFPYARGRRLNENDYRVVDTIVEFWTSFATEGVPRSRNGGGWEPYDSQGQYLRIGNANSTSTSMESKFQWERMRFWSNITLQTCELNPAELFDRTKIIYEKL